MLRSNLLIRLRALWRNRTHAAINIVGLSLGITSAIVIFLIVRFELSYDQFRPDKERIFRVIRKYDNGSVSYRSSAMNYAIVPALRNDFAEAEHVSLVDAQRAVVRVPRRDGAYDKFAEDNIVFVDSSYFDIITQEWLEGNRRSLSKPNTAVLTASIARKYFGTGDALGKVINYNNEFDVTVTGVVKDPPINTDLSFTIFITNELGAVKRGWDKWAATASNVNCVIKLNEGITPARMEERLRGWHLKYIPKEDLEDARNENLLLQPLTQMHFEGQFHNPGGRIVSRESLLTMALIGSVLLLTACVNFINLNSVLIIDRAKETGVRKVMGSTRYQVASQFITETVLITFISLLLSSGLAELMLMQLAPILGYRLNYQPFSDVVTFTFLVGVVIVVALLSGLYPALQLAQFNPVQALKNRIASGPQRGVTLRRSLIVFQLVISQVLIVCTIIAVQQFNHFMKQPLGLDSHSVVEFKIPENGADKMRLLSDRILALPGVEQFTASNSGSIAGGVWSGEFEATVNEKKVKDGTVVKIADEHYLETYRIQLLYGENIIRSDSATRFVVNETFAKVLGFTKASDAIGIPVEVWGRRAMITGIMRDFNTVSLHRRIRPTILFTGPESYHVGAVKLGTENMLATLDKIKTTWEGVFPNHVYEHRFLDETIEKLYDAERKVSFLIGIFAGIAIFIGCIGLFGLISFMARSKTKEIGIRKTLGASVGQVIGLFSKEFLILIGVAFAVAVPVAWYFMNEWLANFEYRIHPSVLTFLLGTVMTCVVVLATVGVRSYRAAVANPVNALRDE